MDEQAAESGKKGARRVLRWGLISVVVLLVLAAVIVVPEFSRANMGSLLIREQHRERSRLEAIAESIAAFEVRHERYPISDEDWAGFEPRVSELLSAGTNSVELQYAIRWDALGHADKIVTMTPDRDFSKASGLVLPWDKRKLGPSINRRGSLRFQLMGDASVMSDMWTEWQPKHDFAEWAGWSFKEERPTE